jgi:hypothetical protein
MNITKVLDALSLEGFKAAKEYAATKGIKTYVQETADGLYFATAYTAYLCWNTNDYNFYGPTTPYKITQFPYNINNCQYELHYTESVIKGKDTFIKLAFNDDTEKLVYLNNKVIPKALKSVITDGYTKFYSAKKESTSLILIYSEPYVLAYVMPTKMKEDKTK